MIQQILIWCRLSQSTVPYFIFMTIFCDFLAKTIVRIDESTYVSCKTPRNKKKRFNGISGIDEESNLYTLVFLY